jgi:hypothetical protein
MLGTNPKDRLASTGYHGMSRGHWLGERLSQYFDQHPEVSREAFLMEAVRKELLSREQAEHRADTGPVRRGGDAPSSMSSSDRGIHAWLNQRLAMLHREPDSIWRRLGRLLFGKPRVQWLP